MRFSTFCVVVALAYAASEELPYNTNTAASDLSDTYKDGVATSTWSAGHHGWDVTQDWLQSGPNNIYCMVDRKPDGSGDVQSDSPWTTHANSKASCQQEAIDAGADYYSHDGTNCRVSMHCKNSWKTSSSQTVQGRIYATGKIANEVPEHQSGWKIYATGMACSVPTLVKYPDASCNIAKCRGASQNNDVVAGDLECGHSSSSGNKGSDCLDDLSGSGSTLKAYVRLDNGDGECKDMNTAASLVGIPWFTGSDTSKGANGVFTKMGVVQVNNGFVECPSGGCTASTASVGGGYEHGIIYLKRMRCNDIASKCVTFKVGYCIKCANQAWRAAGPSKQGHQCEWGGTGSGGHVGIESFRGGSDNRAHRRRKAGNPMYINIDCLDSFMTCANSAFDRTPNFQLKTDRNCDAGKTLEKAERLIGGA
jgi:hypothetical protein